MVGTRCCLAGQQRAKSWRLPSGARPGEACCSQEVREAQQAQRAQQRRSLWKAWKKGASLNPAAGQRTCCEWLQAATTLRGRCNDAAQYHPERLCYLTQMQSSPGAPVLTVDGVDVAGGVDGHVEEV